MSESRSSVPSPLSAEAESRPGLLRVLGPGIATAMVVGNVIGSGIFSTPGGIAAEAGDFSLILTAWIVGGCICMMGALCFAELAVMLPRAGGLYVYLREAYGRPVAFLFGWTEFLFGRPAANGALAVIFSSSFMAALNWKFPTKTQALIAESLLAVSLLAGLAWVNILGVIWGGRVQAGTTLIKAGFLGLMALMPFLMLATTSSPSIDWQNYRSTVDPAQATWVAQFAAAMLAVMWAYNGWHGVTPVAEEIRNPQRNIPIALFGGIGILIVLYVSANLAYHGVLSMQEVSAAGKETAQAMIHKLLLPQGAAVAHSGVAAMSAVIMCSTFGAINSNLMNGPRVSFAMGRDDVFIRQLGYVHVNYRTPAVAIAVQAAMAASLVVVSTLLVAFVERFEGDDVFTMLFSFVVFSASIFYVLCVLAVIVLRRRRPDWPRAYRTWGYPVVPIAWLMFYAWFLSEVYREKPFESNVGLVLILAGIPVYYAWRAWARRNPPVLHDGQTNA